MTLDVVVITVSVVLASVAAGVNIVASKVGPRPLRVMSTVRGVLAAFYAAAYVWLLAHRDQRAHWSQTLSGVALAAWVVVWIVPAIIAIRLRPRADS